MYQPKKETLPTCNRDIEKFGHNLDSFKLSYSAEDNCERQISFSVSLPQTKTNSFLANHHTTHFETFQAHLQFSAPTSTYFKEKTILKGADYLIVFYNNKNTKDQTVSYFQSNPVVNQKNIKNKIQILKGEMSPFET